jgi:hypothetical protein
VVRTGVVYALLAELSGLPPVGVAYQNITPLGGKAVNVVLPDPQMLTEVPEGLGGGGLELTVATTGVVEMEDSQPVVALKELT